MEVFFYYAQLCTLKKLPECTTHQLIKIKKKGFLVIIPFLRFLLHVNI